MRGAEKMWNKRPREAPGGAVLPGLADVAIPERPLLRGGEVLQLLALELQGALHGMGHTGSQRMGSS